MLERGKPLGNLYVTVLEWRSGTSQAPSPFLLQGYLTLTLLGNNNFMPKYVMLAPLRQILAPFLLTG